MRFLSLEIAGYERIGLNMIDYLKIHFEQKIQIILGSNGSGKSSLLGLLDPCPPMSQSFRSGGFHILELEHNGAHYRIENHFKKTGNHHLFIKDGVEIHRSVPATVIRMTVESELGITPEVTALLSGSTRFSQMGPSERRQWFGKFSNTDHSYAFSLYKRHKETHRDVIGAIKHLEQVYLKESSERLTEAQEATIFQELESLKSRLDQLLGLKNQTWGDARIIKNRLLEIEQEGSQKAELLLNRLGEFPNHWGFISLEEMLTQEVRLRTQAEVIKSEITQLTEAIDKKDKVLTDLKLLKVDVKDIDRQIQQLQKQHQGLLQSQYFHPNPDQARYLYDSIIAIQNALQEILLALPTNPNKQINRASYQQSSSSLEQLTSQLRNKEKHYQSLLKKKEDMEHSRDNNHIECPRCKYVWIVGYSESVYQGLLNLLDKTNQEIESDKTAIDHAQERLNQQHNWLNAYQHYQSFIRSAPQFSELWNRFEESQLLFNEPMECMNIIETYKSDLTLSLQLLEIDQEIKNLELMKQSMIDHKEQTYQELKANLDQLKSVLFDQESQYRSRLDQANRIKKQIAIVKEINQLSAEVECLLQEQSQSYRTSLLIQTQNLVNELIQEARLEISQKEHQISQIESRQAKLKSMEVQLQELRIKEEVLRWSLRELSPTEGLIAKSLCGFMNHFVKQLNDFIKEIWLYPLEILPSDFGAIEETELDYKFKVKANEGSPAPDISKGSSSMKEVIDLGFIMLAKHYLGFDDYPLMLDEFGHRMDPSHRQSAFHAISQLISYSNLPQIFIVSHYNECYGNLLNASDILVLCPANLSIPNNVLFNQHATIR